MASADEESLSPKNRLKLLCSYGGKILPRPSDGQLKYVGGETRVLAVPRSISFSELKKRIQEMFNNARVVIKYQIMPEDLDALVSVTCDEDLRHMLHEYDRHEPRSPSNSPRFRLFLFSTASPLLASLSDATAASPIEQRYVEAINGVPPAATPAPSTFSLLNISSSAATSPTSTIDLRDAFRPTRSNLLSTAGDGGGGGKGLHRVRSTPNLGTANLSQMSNGVGPQPYGGHQQDHHHHHHHHYHDGQQVPPPSYGNGGGLWRMGSGPVRYEVCGCGCGCGCGCRMLAAPQPHVRGHRYSHALGPATGSGGCVYFGHVEEPGAVVPPRSCPPHSLPLGVPPRKPARAPIWE